MKITGTFVQPLCGGDIPVMNWQAEEWDAELAFMKTQGIDTIILLRQLLGRWPAYDSAVLRQEEKAYPPSYDYMDMFLTLAEKHDMKMFVPTYEPLHDWLLATYDPQKEYDVFRRLTDEIWARYGSRKAFSGWYFAQEISGGDSFKVAELFQLLSPHVKSLSGGLPVMISPGMRGVKAFPDFWGAEMRRAHAIAPERHRREWDMLMAMMQNHIDIIAFQDGHVDFDELPEYLSINTELAAKYDIECWDNIETFDRDIPNPKFQPIGWEKLRYKLNAGIAAGYSKLITYEFVPFLSPNGCYPSSRYLLKRYQEWSAEAASHVSD